MPDAPVCLACDRDDRETPLVRLVLPVLIHNPIELVGRLEGAEALAPAEHRD